MADRILNIPDEPQEANYIIAYIDLLGTKEKINQGKGSKVFENIYTAFLLAGNIMPQMKDLNYSQMKAKNTLYTVLIEMQKLRIYLYQLLKKMLQEMMY